MLIETHSIPSKKKRVAKKAIIASSDTKVHDERKKRRGFLGGRGREREREREKHTLLLLSTLRRLASFLCARHYEISVCMCLGGLLSIGEDASFTGGQEALVSVAGGHDVMGGVTKGQEASNHLEDRETREESIERRMECSLLEK